MTIRSSRSYKAYKKSETTYVLLCTLAVEVVVHCSKNEKIVQYQKGHLLELVVSSTNILNESNDFARCLKKL